MAIGIWNEVLIPECSEIWMVEVPFTDDDLKGYTLDVNAERVIVRKKNFVAVVSWKTTNGKKALQPSEHVTLDNQGRAIVRDKKNQVCVITLLRK